MKLIINRWFISRHIKDDTHDAENRHNDSSFLDIYVLVVLNQRPLIPGHPEWLRRSWQLRPKTGFYLVMLKSILDYYFTFQLLHGSARNDSIDMSRVFFVRNSSWKFVEQVYLAVIVELKEMLNLGAVDLKSSLSTKLFEILQHFICDCLGFAR